MTPETRMRPKRGRHPMQVAVEILGGAVGTAEVLGITRQAVDKLLKKDVADWSVVYVKAISDATKIPTDTLLLDLGPVRGLVAAVYDPLESRDPSPSPAPAERADDLPALAGAYFAVGAQVFYDTVAYPAD